MLYTSVLLRVGVHGGSAVEAVGECIQKGYAFIRIVETVGLLD